MDEKKKRPNNGPQKGGLEMEQLPQNEKDTSQCARIQEENSKLKRKLYAATLLLEIVAGIAEEYRNQLLQKNLEQCSTYGSDEIGMLLDKIRNLGECTTMDGEIVGLDFTEQVKDAL